MNLKIVLAVVAVGAVAAVGAVTLYLNRDVAEEASIDNALTALEGSASEEASEAGAPDEPTADEPTADEPTSEDATAEDTATADGDVSGTWLVDTTVGEFSFADATSTFVGFRVDEELATVGQTEAIGRTSTVEGEMVIDGTTLQSVDVVANFFFMSSDIPNREGAMRRAMGVDEHPEGTFTLTEPVDFGGVPAEGETITATAIGDLTVNGVTNPVEVELEAQVADGLILVVGRTPVTFADFDITAPQAGPVVSIEQEGTVELQLWFSRA